MNIMKVISTEIVEQGRRWIKGLRTGTKDVRTASQATPFGIDSAPLKDMRAIFARTEERGRSVIVGYLLDNMLAQDGETRLFSLNSDGELQTYLWLKKDGTILLGGDAKNLARFQELKEGFDQLKADLNDLISKYNTHVHSGVTTGGGISGATTTTDTASTASIDDAKIDEIKTL